MNQTSFTPKKIAALVIIGVTLTLVLIVLFARWYPSISITKTPYRSNMIATLQGDYIYSYSGTTFYKTSVKNQDDPIILSQGLRLPRIETSHWIGDKGVVLTFADSGVIRSAVETSLKNLGESWDEDTSYYAWYLDFKTNQLHLINRYGIAGQTIYYSPQTDEVYYVAYSDDLSEEDQAEDLPLLVFSTESKTSKLVTKNAAAANDIQHLGECPATIRSLVCSIQAEDGDYFLYGFSENTKTKLIDRPFNSINPTATPGVYIGTLNMVDPERREEDAELKADVYRIDIENKQVTKLNNTIGSSRSLLANTSQGDNFYVIEPAVGEDSNEIGYISGTTNLMGSYGAKIKATKTDSESKSILGPFSRNKEGLSLFQDVEGDSYLVTPSGVSYEPKTLSDEQVKSLLNSCFSNHTKGYRYTPELQQFKVNIAYDSNFTSSIANFAECATKASPKTSYGYSYIFVGVSTFDGRFVTD
jgi:hypothetical protein